MVTIISLVRVWNHGAMINCGLSWTRWNQFNFQNTIAIYFLDRLDFGCFSLTLFVYLAQSTDNKAETNPRLLAAVFITLSLSIWIFCFFFISLPLYIDFICTQDNSHEIINGLWMMCVRGIKWVVLRWQTIYIYLPCYFYRVVVFIIFFFLIIAFILLYLYLRKFIADAWALINDTICVLSRWFLVKIFALNLSHCAVSH